MIPVQGGEICMNFKSKILTIVASLISVIAITMVTHFALTQMPDDMRRNIDAPEESIDVNAFDAFTGLTPLMQAAIDSDYDRTRILLAQRADPNVVSANNDRDNALNIAIFNGGKLGSLGVAQELMKAGADVNAKNSRGMAPIHFMMQITNADNRKIILKDLMDRGAHINAQNEDGSTMLHIAVTNLDYDWIDYLNKGYGQIINYNIRDNKGRTPLQLALERGLTGDVELGTQSVETSLRNRPIYIGENFDLKKTDSYGRNALQLATIRGAIIKKNGPKDELKDDLDYVKSFLKEDQSRQKPNLAYQDDFGNSVMHYAVTNLNPIDFIKVLLQAEAPVNIGNKLGETPLFNVMKIRDKTLRNRVAKLLIDAGSPVANKNNEGKSVIDYAAADNDMNLVNLLQQTIDQKRKSFDKSEEIEKTKKSLKSLGA